MIDKTKAAPPAKRAINVAKVASVPVDALEYKILSDERVNFTIDKAYKFLELETFEGERPVREGHVQYLFNEFSAKRFLWHQVSLASAVLDGKEYRINGQHTSWMRVNIEPKDDPGKAEVRHVRYKVESSEQLRNLYSAFDRNAPRSVSHVSKVMLLDSEAVEGISVSYLGPLVSGYRLWKFPRTWAGGGSFVMVSAAHVIGSIQHRDGAVFNVTGNYFRLHYEDNTTIRRSAVIAAMFATFDKSVKGSDEFWTPVFTSIGLEAKSDARWQLNRFLQEHGHSLFRGGGKKVISQEAMYRSCINAWNNWRTGTAITRVPIAKTDCERPKAHG